MSSFVMTIDNDAPVDPVEPSIKNRKRYNDNYEVNNNSTVESSSSEEEEEDEDEDESEDEGTPESRTRFVFQDDDSEEEEDYYEAAQTSTWDFKGAISKIKKEDKRLHGQNHMSTVDDKIKKLLSKRVNQNIKVEENKRSDDSSENSNKNLDDSSDNEKSNIDSSNSNEDSNDSDSSDNDEVNSDGSEEFEKPVVIINDQYDDMKARRKALRGSSTTKNNDSFFDDEESARIEAEEARIQAVGTRKKTKKKDTTTTTTTSPSSSTSVTFDALNLSRPLLRAVKSLNFKRPTPIQARAIPLALAGRDLCCNAMTGSGKTAAFLLPILERLLYRPKNQHATRVLIITPTRELATQCVSMLSALGQYTDIRSCLVVGGLSLQAQETDLRTRPDVVVCTPGRMIDLVRNGRSIHLEDIEILILDEADRLLQLGFQDELMELVSHTPSQKQTLLFSATMTTAVDQLMNLSMKRPVKISVDANLNTTSHLRQEFIRITPSLEKSRESILLSLCKRNFFNKTIIFFPLKWQAHRMKIVFGLCQLNAGELHGDMSQAARLSALQDFRDEKVDYLLCTDVAARGLDIPHVETVINFAFPKEVTTYIHRVGRTARAGKSGVSVTLVGEKHRHLMKEVVKRVNKDQKKNSQKQNIKARTIPISIINQYKNEIELIEEDVSEIKALETEEKNLRRAEMEANKVRNMMVHEEDIQARPRRTWFQTKQEKEAASLIGKPKTTEELEKEQEEQSNLNKYGRKKTNDKDRSTFSKFGVIGATGNEKKRPHRLSRKKRRRLEAEIQADKEDRRERREARTRNEEHISVSGKEQAKINDNRQASSARQQKKAKREGGQINAEKLSDKRKENKRKAKIKERQEKRANQKGDGGGNGSSAFGAEMAYASTGRLKRDVFTKESSLKQVGASRKSKDKKNKKSFKFEDRSKSAGNKRHGGKATGFKSAKKYKRR